MTPGKLATERDLRVVTAQAVLIGVVLAAVLWPAAGAAHRMFPSRLQLSPAGAAGIYRVTFRIAYARGAPMPLEARLPERCEPVGERRVTDANQVRTLRWTVDCRNDEARGDAAGDAQRDGLAGATIGVAGLGETGTDVVVSSPHGQIILRPDAPRKALPSAADEASVSEYFLIGIEHIIFGPDHLLFVLGLLLLVGRRPRKLLETITAFTVGHSITLAMATLGVVAVAGGAVEAIIALSILLLAREVLQPEAAGRSYARQAPWVFALVCGLLHGFGFAGALADIGLPDGRIPAALFLFNAGVEVGQLLFVAAAAGLWWAARRVDRRLPARLEPAIAYGLGGVSAYWVIARSVPILWP